MPPQTCVLQTAEGDRAEDAVRVLLEELGEEPSREGLLKTPKRSLIPTPCCLFADIYCMGRTYLPGQTVCVSVRVCVLLVCDCVYVCLCVRVYLDIMRTCVCLCFCSLVCLCVYCMESGIQRP